MIIRLSDNVITPLGNTTGENYSAVKAGQSALSRHEQLWGIPEPFVASLFTEKQTLALAIEGFTRFESLAIRSASKAIADSGIDPASKRTLFILSTTKANIELLAPDTAEAEAVTPSVAAKRIAAYLGITTEPVVVCNACISGVAAIVLALRLLDANIYDKAIICGADVQNKFTVSGFQSLHAMSDNECRPFDIERLGLNLGEAAATLVVGRHDGTDETSNKWAIERGAIRNDAFHISSPSKNGDGARLALEAVTDNIDTTELALINAHGTATLFNDQMESVAIEGAGLSAIPVNGLKGYFGHTLGAAGLLETILTMAAIDDHTILATRGFDESGVSGHISISPENQATEKTAFIKMISGFGGCNGAILAKRGETGGAGASAESRFLSAKRLQPLRKLHSVRLTPHSLCIDGRDIPQTECGGALLTSLYKSRVADYPKFYKMDGLCRLGFVATELLLQQEQRQRFVPTSDRAVILMNHSSSVFADRKYLQSIASADDYFPSPSVFVYTLPNIVTGEIAMRNSYHGETSFYIVASRNDILAANIVSASLADASANSAVAGWIDYYDDSHFEADIYIAEIALVT